MTDWLLKDVKVVPYGETEEDDPGDLAAQLGLAELNDLPVRLDHRPFRPADWVRVGDRIGFVTTNVRTFDEDTLTWQDSWVEVYILDLHRKVLVAPDSLERIE